MRFARALVRLRRRGRADLAGPGRAALFCLGVGVLVLALASPLDAIGEGYLLSAHMLQHVLIGDVAPALLVLAVRGPLSVFLLPAVALRPLGRRLPATAAPRPSSQGRRPPSLESCSDARRPIPGADRDDIGVPDV